MRCAAAIEQALEVFGRIDVLVSNAGYGQLGAFEEVGRDALARQFATNVFGVFDVTRAILPIMRRQRSGHILTISSIAGMEDFEASSVYCATKHAVLGWSEALAKEVAPCVYPGRFRTDFLDSSSVRYGEVEINDYRGASARRRRVLDADNHRQIGNPKKLAQAMLTLLATHRPPIWFAAGPDAYDVFSRKAVALRANVDEWKALTLLTDFT